MRRFFFRLFGYMYKAHDRRTAVLSRKLSVFAEAANIFTYPLRKESVFERDTKSREGICVPIHSLN